MIFMLENGSQSIMPARAANHSAGFGSSSWSGHGVRHIKKKNEYRRIPLEIELALGINSLTILLLMDVVW